MVPNRGCCFSRRPPPAISTPAATALELAAPLVTGDPELRTVPQLELEWSG
ncbi:MAG: type II toxin-antitoxin system VapC family toxin [Acidobacteria bacterium]|nr:type II toxin-antitoxin system VapC family toxin [Acidobacteriota bacterium]